MNVIVSNKQKDIIDNANIDAIKDLNGLFNVDDLINKFKNYFFSKMILDATSVVDFASRDVLNKLATEIGGDKLIILLPSSPEPPNEFKKMLAELKIYNFSNKIEDVVKYISTPNTYEDVMSSISNSQDNFYVDNSIKDFNNENNASVPGFNGNFGSSNFNAMNMNFNDVSNFQNQQNMNNNQMNYNNMPLNLNSNNNMNMDNGFNNLNSIEMVNSMNTSNGSFYNEENNMNINNNYSENNSFLNMGGYTNSGKKIIGIKNVTEHAGSTTLTYLMKKEAEEKLRLNVIAIEINKNDFKFFNNDKMVSVDEKNVLNAINSSNVEIIFVDLNDCKDISFCQDIIYLIEPSIIKLNKLMMDNKYIFRTLQNKKVVLNKSLLSTNDIRALSSEAGVDMFFNIEPINDRLSNNVILKFLSLLGIK